MTWRFYFVLRTSDGGSIKSEHSLPDTHNKNACAWLTTVKRKKKERRRRNGRTNETKRTMNQTPPPTKTTTETRKYLKWFRCQCERIFSKDKEVSISTQYTFFGAWCAIPAKWRIQKRIVCVCVCLWVFSLCVCGRSVRPNQIQWFPFLSSLFNFSVLFVSVFHSQSVLNTNNNTEQCYAYA